MPGSFNPLRFPRGIYLHPHFTEKQATQWVPSFRATDQGQEFSSASCLPGHCSTLPPNGQASGEVSPLRELGPWWLPKGASSISLSPQRCSSHPRVGGGLLEFETCTRPPCPGPGVAGPIPIRLDGLKGTWGFLRAGRVGVKLRSSEGSHPEGPEQLSWQNGMREEVGGLTVLGLLGRPKQMTPSQAS